MRFPAVLGGNPALWLLRFSGVDVQGGPMGRATLPPPSILTEACCFGWPGWGGRWGCPVSHPSLLDLLARASPGSEELCLWTRDRLEWQTRGPRGGVGAPRGSLSFPISGRWRLIIWEEAFFCFLCHEHMEVKTRSVTVAQKKS